MEDPTESAHAPERSSAVSRAETKPIHISPVFYALALFFGLFSGWVNEKVDDALLTSLCMLVFTMLLGVWKKQKPWRWMLLVWIGVPLVMGYYQFVMHWPHSRGQVWAALLQVLAASAGAHGGHYMRDMIDHVFLKHDD